MSPYQLDYSNVNEFLYGSKPKKIPGCSIIRKTFQSGIRICP